MKITDATFTVRPVSSAGQAGPQPDTGQPSWRPGQILQATVTSAGDGLVTLDMNGRQFAAQDRLGLREGQQLLLHVAATSPQVQLQTLGLNTENPQNIFLQVFGAGWDLPALLRQIQDRRDTGKNPLFDLMRDAMKAFMAGLEDPATAADATALAALLQRLGVARLKQEDPSGTLRQALLGGKGDEPRDEEPSSELLDSLARSLETLRRLNLQLQPEGSVLLPLPLPFLKQGFLLIGDAAEETGSDSASSRKICLQLSLENLGELRVDMLWDQAELLIKFTCENNEANRKLSESGEELRQALHFRPPREIIFTTGNPRSENSLLEQLGAQPSGFVNTRI